MNIAGAQLHRLFQEIADRPDDRCAGSKIAQALDVILARIAYIPARLRRCHIVACPLVEGMNTLRPVWIWAISHETAL